MRYFKKIFLFLVIILISCVFILNSLLLINKNKIKKNFKNLGVNIEYKYLFYLLPNILIVKDLSFENLSAKFYINNSLFFINIFETLKHKKLYIYSVKVNRFFLQIKSYGEKNHKKTELPLIDKRYIDKNLKLFPQILLFRNGVIKYKDILEIKNIFLESKRVNEKINLHFNGEEKNYKINLIFYSNSDKWILKTKFIANNEITSYLLPEIKLKLSGDYDLYGPKNYNISLRFLNKETLKILGKINFYYLKLEGEIKGEILKGNFSLDKIDDKFKGMLYAELGLNKFFKDIKDKKNLTAESNFYFSDLGYQVSMKFYNDIFTSEFFLKDNIGYLKIIPKKYNILKRSILSKIDYDKDKKFLNIYSKDELMPFNFVLDLNYVTNLKINGNFLGTEVSGYLFSHRNKTEAIIDFKSVLKTLNFKFLKDGSDIYSNINFINKNKKSYIYGELTNSKDNKKFNFNIEARNLFINKTKVSFKTDGYINRHKDVDNLVGDMFLKDLFFEGQKIFDSVNGKIYLENNFISLKIKDVDKTLSGELNYNLDKNVYEGKIEFVKSKLKIEKFLVDCFINLQFKKTDKIKLSGNYKLQNILFENNKLFGIVQGDIYNDSKGNIFLEGKVLDDKSKNLLCSYRNILNIKKDILNINLFKLKLFGKEIFNLELNFSKLFSEAKDKDIIKKVYFNGKIYNEESEIIVLPSYVLKNFDSLKLNLKIKNLNLNKNSFVGDLVLNIENINKNFVDSKLEINNLWINNYFVGKAIIEMSYNSKQKTLDFIVDDKLQKRTDVLKVRGSVIFAKNNTRFKNLKLYLQESQYIFLNGNLGNNGDILDVKFFNIPIEILNSILRFSEPDIVGFVYGDVNIKTISSFDKDYKIDANFVAKDVNFKMAKIPEVLLNLVYEKEKVILEKLIFNFIDKGKIEAKGFYNVSSKNCDFVVKSIKCNLSILDNFYDIVKSAEGSFITELSIKGKINNPQIKGYFYLPKGNLKFKKYISYLNNTTIKLNFLNDKIEVEKFHGYCKDTKLIVSGIWSFSDTAKLKIFTQGGKGVEVFVYELSFPKSEFLKFVQDTSLYPSRGDMHFDLYITKQKDGIPPKVEGKIILNNTHFTYPGVKKYYITPEVRNLYYDITIVAKDNVWYSNELISANIVGSVNLNYTKLNTKTDINGEAIALSGNMKFLNTNFRIKSGQIQIIKRIPYLELIGETEAIFSNREKMKVQLIVDRSQIEDIKPRLISTSHPTLKSEDIASILLNIGELQKTEKEDYVIAKEQLDFNSLLRTQFIRLIDSTLATPIARGILQKWGIVDNITISQLPSGVAAEKQTVYQSSNGITKDTISFIDIIKNTKYGIEKYITSDMILSYSVALAEYQQKLNLRHELEIGYRLKGNVFIKGIYDYGIRDYNTGRYGGDIKIQVEPVFRLKSWAEEEKE